MAGTRIISADHDPIRMLKVPDRCPLSQELWVGHHCEVGVRARLLNDTLDLVASADWNGRLGCYHREVIHCAGNFARNLTDVAQVGVTVAAPRRRAHCNEYGFRLGHRLSKIGGEFESAFACIDLD